MPASAQCHLALPAVHKRGDGIAALGKAMLVALQGQMVWFGQGYSEVRPRYPPLPPMSSSGSLHGSEPQASHPYTRTVLCPPFRGHEAIEALSESLASHQDPSNVCCGYWGQRKEGGLRNLKLHLEGVRKPGSSPRHVGSELPSSPPWAPSTRLRGEGSIWVTSGPEKGHAGAWWQSASVCHMTACLSVGLSPHVHMEIIIVCVCLRARYIVHVH